MTKVRKSPVQWSPEDDRILAQEIINQTNNGNTIKFGLEMAASKLKRSPTQCSARYYSIKDKIKAVSTQITTINNNPHIRDANLRVDIVVSLFKKLDQAQKLLVIEEVF